MQALETFPPFNRKDLNDATLSEEYGHAKNYSRGRTCGTLSKSEWEAICKWKKGYKENLGK